MKIKSLLPTITGIGLSIVPTTMLTSCGNKKETECITTTYDTPVINKDFVINFKLDNNYSLDVINSTIEFADTNSVIYLNQCTIDKTNYKVTVPASLVTSTQVKVNFVSVKQNELSKNEIQKSFEEVFKENDTKKITASGEFYSENTIAGKKYSATTSQNVIMNGSKTKINLEFDTSVNTKSTQELYFSKADDFGYWSIYKNSLTDKYEATPQACYVMEAYWNSMIAGDDFFNKIAYDTILNTYTYNNDFEISGYKYNLAYNFSIDKNNKLINLFVETSTDSSMIYAKGNVVFEHNKADEITIPEFTQTSVKTPDDFIYESGAARVYNCNKFTTYDLNTMKTKGLNFETNKKTYIYLFEGEIVQSLLDLCPIIIYNGDNLLERNKDYSVVYSTTTKQTNVIINENVLDSTKNIKFVINDLAISAIIGSELGFKIYQ